jgi:hypothetical protein
MFARGSRSFALITVLVALAAAAALASLTSSAGAVSTSLVINEVDYDQPSTDTAEFMELKNVSGSAINLDSYTVELVNGTGGGATIYQTIDLPSVSLAAGDYYVVCANAATTANCDLDVSPDTNLIQNGAPDAIGLRESGTLVDALSYEGDSGAPYTEGSGLGLDDNAAAPSESLSRCPDGTDTDQNNADFLLRADTPGTANSCPPAPVALEISEIQGASHLSPYAGALVLTSGIATAKTGNGFYLQDPTPDADEATSEAIFVFTASAPSVSVGDELRVRGNVSEFRPGGAGSSNLSATELTSPAISLLASGNPLPAPLVIGTGGRIPPAEVIEDDASGNVETSGLFDPAQDGIDFYESLEAMRVQVNDALVVGARSSFGEIPVVGDNSANAGIDTVRGGVVISPDDFNPERIILDDTISTTPLVDVEDSFTTPVVGVIDYSFGNFKLNVTVPLTAVSGGLEREVTPAASDRELLVGTYNVENLDPTDASFARHADLIVNHLRSPDLLAIEEIQDNDGAANTPVTDASLTWSMLISAIEAAGGPTYEYRQIDPVDDQDGGEPGGNIRVGFLFRSDRGLNFIDRPGGDSTTATTVVDDPSGPQLSFSPGRVDPQNAAYTSSRKPLAGEFRMRGKKLFVIANHFSSKGGDQPLFGRFQPPQRSSEVARHAQAQSVHDFVESILALDPQANVIVLGDINDFEFSETVQILGAGGVLSSLMETLPKAERYSYVFEGNSQVLDQMLVSENLLGNFGIEYDPVHVNSEFADQASDHDPQVARLDLRGRPR